MNSKDWILNACDISTDSSLILSDKETQTSKPFLINSASSNVSPSRPLPHNIEAVSKDGKPKVYEYCETIQDPCNPGSVITIKEIFTEESLSDSNCGFDKPTKNKYRYCKEVIEPISKTHPKDCPQYFPKCSRIKKCRESCQNKIKDDCIKDKENTMKSDKCKTTIENPKNPPNNCDKKEKEKKCCPKECIKDEKPSCEPQPPVCQRAEPFDQCQLKKCVSACISESFNLAKRGSTSCLEEFEKVIGVTKPQGCSDKPTYYVMEKSKSSTDSSKSCTPKGNSASSVFDSQSKTVANITCAIRGFMGTVYNKTIDAVNMIKTESCRHLGLDDDAKPPIKDNKTEKQTKECSSKVSETKMTSLYDSIEGESSKRDSVETYNIEKILEPAKEVIDQVVSAVSSTVSILKNSSFEQIVDGILDGKMEKSSAYDNPDADNCNPKKIAQDLDPSANSSVFTMLKAKILSIFDIQQESCQDDNDEDDENSAEKLFEKFCEQ